MLENVIPVPISAIVIKWSFATKEDDPIDSPCPPEKLEMMTKLLIASKYVPFALGKSNHVLRNLETNKFGIDWPSGIVVWLNRFVITLPTP